MLEIVGFAHELITNRQALKRVVMKSGISAFTPVFNHADYLPKAIDSVLAQTQRPDEYLIIDDGSTDETWTIIQEYQRRFSCIRGIRNPKNLGLLSSLTRWPDLIKGDYTFGLAADDQIHPDFCALSYEAAQAHPAAGIHVGRVWGMSESGQIRNSPRSEFEPWNQITFLDPSAFLSEYLTKMPVTYSPSPATMYRCAALKEAGGFRPELGNWTDTFVIQAIGLKHGCCYLPDTGSFFMHRANSFSQLQWRDLPMMKKMVETAHALMVSEEFQSAFPRWYANEWRTRYLEAIVESEVKRISRIFSRGDAEVLKALEDEPVRIAHICMKLIRILRRPLLASIRMKVSARLNSVVDASNS
jgi:glycosyltransferase involved in cell wall biosynthesis